MLKWRRSDVKGSWSVVYQYVILGRCLVVCHSGCVYDMTWYDIYWLQLGFHPVTVVGKVKAKVKFTLVQALSLCTGSTTHRWSRGIAPLFLDHGTRRGWGVSVTPRPLFTLGKDPVPIVQETGSAPGPVWTDAENLAPTGIRSPDRPARNQSLYRLSCPAHSGR